MLAIHEYPQRSEAEPSSLRSGNLVVMTSHDMVAREFWEEEVVLGADRSKYPLAGRTVKVSLSPPLYGSDFVPTRQDDSKMPRSMRSHNQDGYE